MAAGRGELVVKGVEEWGQVIAMTIDVKLDRGPTIRLVELRQYRVYEGLLEGLPTREMNDRLIEARLSCEREHSQLNVVLLEPSQTPIPWDRPYPFGEPATLPATCCVARFRAAGERPDRYSSLVLVWFQDEFALPVDPTILERIRALDWECQATYDDL